MAKRWSLKEDIIICKYCVENPRAYCIVLIKMLLFMFANALKHYIINSVKRKNML